MKRSNPDIPPPTGIKNAGRSLSASFFDFCDFDHWIVLPTGEDVRVSPLHVAFCCIASLRVSEQAGQTADLGTPPKGNLA